MSPAPSFSLVSIELSLRRVDRGVYIYVNLCDDRHRCKVSLRSFCCGNLAHLTFVNSYGTAKSGVGISAMAVLRPDMMMKCVVPVIMAGIIAVSVSLRIVSQCSLGSS